MIYDHSNIHFVQTIAIAEFKAKCLAILERVRKTGEAVLVTRRGTPVAQVVPPPPAAPPSCSTFGAMKGTAREIGDALEPLPPEDWEALS